MFYQYEHVKESIHTNHINSRAPRLIYRSTRECSVTEWMSRYKDVFSILKENHMVTTASSKNRRWLYLLLRHPRDISIGSSLHHRPVTRKKDYLVDY